MELIYNTCSVKVTNLLPFPVKESQQSFTLNDALGFIQNKMVWFAQRMGIPSQKEDA